MGKAAKETKPAHPPGPWTIEQSIHGATIRAADGEDVASGIYGPAAATLIAAAPDLLGELGYQANTLEAFLAQAGRITDTGLRRDLAALVYRARAAIAKARGES